MNENKRIKLEAATVYDDVKKKYLKDFNRLNTLARKGQIVFAGDSIIELWPISELLFDLRKKTGLETYNRGIGGDTSNRFLERIESNVCAVLPKVIYILIGTNDIGCKFPEEYSIENIGKTIEDIKLHCPDAVIFVQSLFPVNKDLNKSMVGARKNKKIVSFNNELKILAQRNGCVFVDIFDAFLDQEGDFSAEYTSDGLHPSLNGYIKLSSLVTDAILSNADFSRPSDVLDFESIAGELESNSYETES